MSNEVIFHVYPSTVIPLKYVGDTEVQDLPCTVTDMIDQGVIIADGRYSDEQVWEGEGAIISPAIPDGTLYAYPFTHPDLAPADPAYDGVLYVDFREGVLRKVANIQVSEAPPI